ncbi:MAG: hypothetical protein GWM90_25075, partial [Gemmatimonadetes bacterium]|nr:hypothetical protein [Gemmatimonadota bacterium]NIQ58063.1 hypothetical protein [Gemmatimonadota bacterium]NIU78246.1 hypothetical protein [Gammaproteobacteria bacterium]NIX47230.1 hypothetical protein [Gemmatimonadota bacterium]NIY11604.1 hypothetical protein [Gemmatimonadota bacterium]
ALARGDVEAAVRLVRGAPAPGESPVLVDARGRTRAGVEPATWLVDATRRGEAPVGFVEHGGSLHAVSLAPIPSPGGWR